MLIYKTPAMIREVAKTCAKQEAELISQGIHHPEHFIRSENNGLLNAQHKFEVSFHIVCSYSSKSLLQNHSTIDAIYEPHTTDSIHCSYGQIKQGCSK